MLISRICNRGRNRARIRDRDRGGNRTVARTHMG
jgi:hypothetical protein